MDITSLIFGISAMLAGAAYHPDGYLEAGITYHSIELDEPEINGLGNYLFEIESGVELDRTKIYFRHISGITETEEGGGLNQIGIKYKIK